MQALCGQPSGLLWYGAVGRCGAGKCVRHLRFQPTRRPDTGVMGHGEVISSLGMQARESSVWVSF